MSGIINLVAKVDSGKYKTIKQVGEIVGRDPSTIRQAVRDERVEGPTHKMLLGDGTDPDKFVWLYTDEDIARLQQHFSKMPHRSRTRKKTVA